MLRRDEFSVESAAEAAPGIVMTHTDSALCVAGIVEDTRLCRMPGAGC